MTQFIRVILDKAGLVYCADKHTHTDWNGWKKNDRKQPKTDPIEHFNERNFQSFNGKNATIADTYEPNPETGEIELVTVNKAFEYKKQTRGQPTLTSIDKNILKKRRLSEKTAELLKPFYYNIEQPTAAYRKIHKNSTHLGKKAPKPSTIEKYYAAFSEALNIEQEQI